MTDYLEVWIRKEHLSPDELKNYPNNIDCIKILIDKVCKICNKKRVLSEQHPGDEVYQTIFTNPCLHSYTYEDVYKHRVRTIGNIVVGSVSISRADPKTDGMKCSGVCGQWIPMAQANQKDNSFKCWSCRTRGW